ncbi:MAG: c-type cytochrome [Synechococcales cyanobacterium RM1_1_8]|nr:c-type cytochrome [Synechococcales cyanobacterium RM1_1_8]
MKRFLTLLVVILTTITLSITNVAAPALAGDAAAGKAIFGANCAACHIGGGNVINSAKTLKKEALDQYEMASIEKITYQVTNGKNAMPAFKGKLSEEAIENVATYVLAQAEQGW